MPKKKKALSKTRFVLGLPRTLSAKEVLAKAKAVGLTLSEKYVYVIRSKAKASRKKGNGRAAARQRSPQVAGLAEAIDARFATLALDLGLARAEEILRSMRAKARAGALG